MQQCLVPYENTREDFFDFTYNNSKDGNDSNTSSGSNSNSTSDDNNRTETTPTHTVEGIPICLQSGSNEMASRMESSCRSPPAS